MQVIFDKELFDEIPGLCVGIIALRAADNRGVNQEADAFRSRCCTEANLLLKINPHMADPEIDRYARVMEKLSMKGVQTALMDVFADYREGLEAGQEPDGKNPEVLSQPKKADLEELTGSDILERRNPISDMIRGAMLKFHVEIHAYDMGDRTRPLCVRKKDGRWNVYLGEEPATEDWLGSGEQAGKVTADSENILVLITGFAPNRKKVASARNELARRMKSAFDRTAEVGWLEGDTHEFTADIG